MQSIENRQTKRIFFLQLACTVYKFWLASVSLIHKKGEHYMKSEWKVTSNPFGGTTMYAVYRNLDTSKVDHSGNREYATGYLESRQDAIDIAEDKNRQAD